MAFGYTVTHIEWLANVAYGSGESPPSEIEFLLYDDREDDPDKYATLDDIETEPDDGSYERATVSWGDLEVDYPDPPEYIAKMSPGTGQIAFDLTDTTGEVNAVGVVWQAFGDDQLMSRSELDGVYDLENYSGETTVTASWQLATLS